MPGLTDQVKRGAGIGEFIRDQREQAQVSVRQLARLAGVSNPYLSQIERGLRKPSAEILQQIAKGLRISAEQLYVQAGILEPATAGADDTSDRHVMAAILTDPHLAERQKQVLIDVYQAFCAENGTRTADAVAVAALDAAALDAAAVDAAAVDPAVTDANAPTEKE